MTHVAVTIIVALVASLFIAQTLVPMLAARVPMLPEQKEGAVLTRLTRRYTNGLQWILRHPWWTGLGIVLTCLIGVMPLVFQLVKFDAFPQESGRRLYMPYHIEGQHPLELVEKTVYDIENFLFDHKEEFDIRSVYSYYEKGRAESVILLTEDDEATLSTREIIQRIEKSLPAIAIGKPNFEFDQQGGGDGFSVQVSGDSTSRLNELSVDLVRTLAAVPGLKDVRSDSERGEREVQVSVDRNRAAAVGLTTREIAGSIAIAMRGQNLREFRGEMGEVGVRLAFRDNDQQNIDQLADLPLYSPEGRRITLGSVASFRIGHSPDTIRRTDRQTAVVITANLDDDYSLENVQPVVKNLMNDFQLPPGYGWKFGRGFER
jgi:HAE1 family hydrophobic/amphiphilic exporter-1